MYDRRSDVMAFVFSGGGGLIIMIATLAKYPILTYVRVFLCFVIVISIIFIVKDLFERIKLHNVQNISRIIAVFMLFLISFLPYFKKFSLTEEISTVPIYTYTVKTGFHQYVTDSVIYSSNGVTFITPDGKEHTLSDYEVIRNEEKSAVMLIPPEIEMVFPQNMEMKKGETRYLKIRVYNASQYNMDQMKLLSDDFNVISVSDKREVMSVNYKDYNISFTGLSEGATVLSFIDPLLEIRHRSFVLVTK